MRIVQPRIDIVTDIDTEKAYKFIEACGRTCYKSWDKTSEGTAERMIKSLIKSGHESVLEHYQVTIRMLCDIGVYKDLTRHRHASFSIESTRWCNYNKDRFGNEITFIEPAHINSPELHREWYKTMQMIEKQYMKMAEMGAKPDQLRMVLPHSTAAEVTMSANLREWRHLLKLRTAPDAHPTVRQLMGDLLDQFKEKLPAVFEDIENKSSPTIYKPGKDMER